MISSLRRRACCAAFVCLFALVGVAVAQTPPEIVVTGSREPLAPERLAAGVVVIGLTAQWTGSELLNFINALFAAIPGI